MSAVVDLVSMGILPYANDDTGEWALQRDPLERARRLAYAQHLRDLATVDGTPSRFTREARRAAQRDGLLPVSELA